MYTLLIADDEPLECDAIELLVTRAKLPIRVVKAGNGNEAVLLAKQYHPHIAFLDIRMPGMDGLEAAKLIRKEHSECYIVFLTAWSTFEYAHQAIRLKASEYLVKPVQRKEVYDLLDRLIANLEKQKENKLQQEEEIREVLNIFSREFFAALKYGRVSEDAMQSYFMMQGIKEKEGVALIIGGLQEEEIQEFFMQGRTWGHLWLSYFPSVDRITVLLFTNQSAKVIEQIAGRQKEQEITIGIGVPFNDFALIPHSIATASIAYTTAFRQNLRLQRYSDVLVTPKDQRKIIQIRNQMLSETLDAKLERARTLAHELLDVILGSHEQEERAIDELFEVLTVFSYEVSKAVTLLRIPSVPKSSVREMEIYLMDLLDTACKAIEQDRMDRYERPFAFIKQYLEEHMESPISLEDAANLIGLNTKYFSQLCKTYLGATFVEYLTRVRMEKAYKLLCDSNYTIREVAEMTGFHDQNYFSRVFRQHHGVPPSSLKGS